MASSYGTDADKSALRAGSLAARQQIPSNPLPVEAFDVPVDFIATEGSVWACR